jgi:hypothetical protein
MTGDILRLIADNAAVPARGVIVGVGSFACRSGYIGRPTATPG